MNNDFQRGDNSKTYIFIPGGWHGGWVFDPVIKLPELSGSRCIALTLPGLEVNPGKNNPAINLDTHINFVIDFLEREQLTDIILCGHSYAGMVITGVADRVSEKIYGLIYIDAYVPANGDSCWSLTSDMYRDRFVKGAGKDGYMVEVPEGPETRRRPHPLASFMQTIRLTGKWKQIQNLGYIYLSGWEGTPFTTLYENLKQTPGWITAVIHSVHNVMREHPEELVAVLTEFEKQFTKREIANRVEYPMPEINR